MSDQKPSERAMDCASEWQGHQFSCAIYGDCELPDSACTCIVRKLAISIDTAIREAVEAERKLHLTPEQLDGVASWILKHGDLDNNTQVLTVMILEQKAAAIRARRAQEK